MALKINTGVATMSATATAASNACQIARALLLTLLVSADAMAKGVAAPLTYMVLPSQGTAAALEGLSRKSTVVAHVLTVDRREYVLRLDGSGDGAFSGPQVALESDSAAPIGPAVRIPLTDLALVYYLELPAADAAVHYRLSQARYPQLPAVGAAEKAFDCGTLSLEVERAATIRWYARHQSGSQAYTDHQARVLHTEHGLAIAGLVVLTVVVLAAASGGYGGGTPVPIGGGFGGTAEPASVSVQTYRWALTAADRREVALLELERDRSCEAHPTPAGSTDQQVLAAIAATHTALTAQRISDLEQMNQQTALLDQLDPPSPPFVRAATDREREAQVSMVRIPTDEGAAATRGSILWFQGADALDNFRHYQAALGRALRGTVTLTDRSLTFLSDPEEGQTLGLGAQIPYSDISSITVSTFVANATVVVTRRDGKLDSFQIHGALGAGRTRTEALADELRARVRAAQQVAATVPEAAPAATARP